jgi:hypothetical protein
LFEGVAVEVAPNVATTALLLSASFRSFDCGETYWVAIVIPGATDAATLFQDDEVAAVVASDQVDRSAHACVPINMQVYKQ